MAVFEQQGAVWMYKTAAALNWLLLCSCVGHLSIFHFKVQGAISMHHRCVCNHAAYATGLALSFSGDRFSCNERLKMHHAKRSPRESSPLRTTKPLPRGAVPTWGERCPTPAVPLFTSGWFGSDSWCDGKWKYIYKGFLLKQLAERWHVLQQVWWEGVMGGQEETAVNPCGAGGWWGGHEPVWVVSLCVDLDVGICFLRVGLLSAQQAVFVEAGLL